jgi:hypothetical protein
VTSNVLNFVPAVSVFGTAVPKTDVPHTVRADDLLFLSNGTKLNCATTKYLAPTEHKMQSGSKEPLLLAVYRTDQQSRVFLCDPF